MSYVSLIVENNYKKSIDTLIKKLTDNIYKYMKVNNAILTNKIKNDKLNNNVLNIRTGNLKKSIKGETTKSSDAITVNVYTDSPYARIHEYGYTGTQNITRLSKNGKSSSYTRYLVMPERSFMRSSLNDLKDKLVENIQLGVTETIKEW